MDKAYTHNQLRKLLNENQKKFCHEYIKEWNKTQSYLKAYPKCKTENAAAASAIKLLSNTKIDQYIDFIKEDIEKECGISKISNVMALIEISNKKDASYRDQISARTEIAKLLGHYAPEKKSVVVDTGIKLNVNFKDFSGE